MHEIPWCPGGPLQSTDHTERAYSALRDLYCYTIASSLRVSSHNFISKPKNLPTPANNDNDTCYGDVNAHLYAGEECYRAVTVARWLPGRLRGM